MALIFVRHGMPRRSEADPGLTSEGRRQAREVGQWITGLERPAHSAVLHTDTARTQQTAEEIGLVLDLPSMVIRANPETWQDWEVLADTLSDRLRHGAGADALRYGLLVIVGHHPTIKMLLDELGPPPVPASPRFHCVGLLLEPRPKWHIVDAWPGRLSS